MEDFAGMKSYWHDLKLLIKKSQDFLKILVLDLWFLIAAGGFIYLANTVISEQTQKSVVWGISVLVFYFVTLITIYSIFKLYIIKIITKSENLKTLNFHKFKDFFLSTLITTMFLLIIWITVNAAAKSLNESYQTIGRTLLIGSFYFFGSLYLQISHATFSKNMKIVSFGTNIRRTLDLRRHKEVYFGVFILMIFLAIIGGVGSVLSHVQANPYEYFTIQGVLNTTFITISIVLSYVVFTLTRYLIIRK
jgi:hypothetical protein